MGFLRIILALTIVFTHSTYGEVFLGHQLAVQIFYMISGFLIAHVLHTNPTYTNPIKFYINRALRIYPIYFIVLFLTIVYMLLADHAAFDVYSQIPLSAKAILSLSNFTIIGQDWVMFTGVVNGHTSFVMDFRDSIPQLWHGLFIPQAWTLDIELCFYLLAPFILKNTKLTALLLGLSFALRIIAIQMGFGEADPWTYRFFPFELALFLLGALSNRWVLPLWKQFLQKREKSPLPRMATFGLVGFCIFFTKLPIHYPFNTALLIILCTILLPLTFIFQQTSKADRFVGELSYPIYISHVLIAGVTASTLTLLHVKLDGMTETLILIVVTSFWAHYLTVFVSGPVERMRKRIRSNSNNLPERNPMQGETKMDTTGNLNPITLQQSGLVQTENGFSYRDLNKNGKLDIYEDPRQPIEARVEDLLSQMTLAEKAGLLFINGSRVSADGSIEEKPDAPGFGGFASQQITQHQMNHFNLWTVPSAQATAIWHNNLQKFAEQTRLGIPVTIASDPRNHFSETIFSMGASDFSQWCETPGFAAIGDPELVRKFADIVRREYLAVGIRVALHPQIDLATEPRWPRISGTFGEDAHLTALLAGAYIRGFQGEQLGPESVACMTKHFPGGGPQKDGLDPHFEFQQGQIYPGNNFDYHLIPFEAAFAAQTASIMPYYGVPTDQTDENVAMSFNKMIITSLLREKYQYDGVVCTDWGLITDANVPGFSWPARAWGVEHLSRVERVKKALDAGVDQFGGENCPELVVELVESGQLTEARIDQSVRRLLRQKFQLGLFDNPFVDADKVSDVLGIPESLRAGLESQKQAMTLLKNEKDILPLKSHPKIYVKNMNAAVAAQYGDVVEIPSAADFAILRLATPWVPHPEAKNPFALSFHHGDLDFKGEAKDEILTLLKTVPTIVVIYLDRPAVIPEISAAAMGLLGEYGASDEAVLDVIFGKASPQGKLPFELPSSMEAVRNQKADVPYDSVNPLYPYGFGLSY